MVSNARKLVKNQFCSNPPVKNVVSQTGWKKTVGSFSKQIEYEEVWNITESLGHFGLQGPLRGTKPQSCEQIFCLQKQHFPIWWRNCSRNLSTKLSLKNKTSQTTLQSFLVFSVHLASVWRNELHELKVGIFFNWIECLNHTRCYVESEIEKHKESYAKLMEKNKKRFFGKKN